MENEIICFECGAQGEYEIREIERLYEGEGYQFEMLVKVPFCKKCGAPIYDVQIENEIAKKANLLIREQKGIITNQEIQDILKKYNVSQKYLSRILGWGEITLTRYISGNYTPNIVNSNRLKEIRNPYIFLKLLEEEHDKTEKSEKNEKAFQKAKDAVYQELEKLEKHKGKIFRVVNWFLGKSSEDVPITHLALQKILYFVQGWSDVLCSESIFQDDCQAWAHGAVYPQVYDIFKYFKYNPLPKVEKELSFSEEELQILYMVKNYYYEVYSARTLENICHYEKPYRTARDGCEDGTKCTNVIKRADMIKYYTDISKEYNIEPKHLSSVQTYLNRILNSK